MFILVSCFILFGTALALALLKITRPNTRYPWLVAVGGGLLGLTSVFLWLAQIPLSISMQPWEPQTIFIYPISFQADSLAWAYAVSLSAITLTVLLTAITRPAITNSYTWAGALALGGLGLLAVTANNPLTLLLVWGALDVMELIIQLRSVDGPENNENVVFAFSTRILGIGVLLWANMVNLSAGGTFDFGSIAPAAGLYLVLAAGLRLGVLPLHLPYSSESTLRRGFGTSLRLVSAASCLALLAHIPAGSLLSIFTPFLMIFAIVAAVYGGWMWMRAPDELNGRPYWIIGVAALSIVSALSGNPLGTVSWGCALILAGGALFLASVQQAWLNRALLVGAFSLSSLPFSLTASAWTIGPGIYIPFGILAQAMLISGYIRHALRPGERESLEAQPNWTRSIYPSAIGLLIALQVLLGLIGWDGARRIGGWQYAVFASLLTLSLVWATPRFRLLNPTRAHWVVPMSPSSSGLYGFLWNIHNALGRLNQALISALEGDGGVMWILLFMVLFISLMKQGTP